MGCDSPNQGTKALEIGRNDLSGREAGNRVLILRDYIVSAASQINAGGGSNGDNPTNMGVSDFSLVATTLDTNNAFFNMGVLKLLVIDLDLPLAA